MTANETPLDLGRLRKDVVRALCLRDADAVLAPLIERLERAEAAVERVRVMADEWAALRGSPAPLSMLATAADRIDAALGGTR